MQNSIFRPLAKSTLEKDFQKRYQYGNFRIFDLEIQ